MKFTKLFSLFLALALICASLIACDSNQAADDEKANAESTTTTQKEEETIFTIIKGAYKQEDSYGSTTFIFDGSDVTCITEDYYYEQQWTSSGTFEITEEEGVIQGTFAWTDTEQGVPSFRTFTYDPENKTITSATDFQTYLFEKQK